MKVWGADVQSWVSEYRQAERVPTKGVWSVAWHGVSEHKLVGKPSTQEAAQQAVSEPVHHKVIFTSNGYEHKQLDLEWDKKRVHCARGKGWHRVQELEKVMRVTIQGRKANKVLELNRVKENGAWEGKLDLACWRQRRYLTGREGKSGVLGPKWGERCPHGAELAPKGIMESKYSEEGFHGAWYSLVWGIRIQGSEQDFHIGERLMWDVTTW